MLTSVDILPAGTIGFVAHGCVTEADSSRVLEPTLLWARERGPVRLFYEIGADFSGYESGAAFDEAVFGSRHFAAFAKIAFVADDCRWRRAVGEMVGLMPAELRLFGTRDGAVARLWLGESPTEVPPAAEPAKPATGLDRPEMALLAL